MVTQSAGGRQPCGTEHDRAVGNLFDDIHASRSSADLHTQGSSLQRVSHMLPRLWFSDQKG